MRRTFGKRLKEAREGHPTKITQERLAEILGVSVSAVRKWERGGGYPKCALLITIADMFGEEIDWMLGRKTSKNKERGDSVSPKGKPDYTEGGGKVGNMRKRTA